MIEIAHNHTQVLPLQAYNSYNFSLSTCRTCGSTVEQTLFNWCGSRFKSYISQKSGCLNAQSVIASVNSKKAKSCVEFNTRIPMKVLLEQSFRWWAMSLDFGAPEVAAYSIKYVSRQGVEAAWLMSLLKSGTSDRPSIGVDAAGEDVSCRMVGARSTRPEAATTERCTRHESIILSH